MSDDIIDMGIDPFDDLVETGDFDETNESDSEEDSGDSEADLDGDSEDSAEDVGEESGETDEIGEDSEEQGSEEQDEESQEDEKSEEDADGEESEEGSDDESGSVDLAKAIKEGSLEIEVDGEKVTLQDLKNDRIGQKEISRRFTEVDREKKQMESDVNEINEYINTFAGKLKDGDSVGAMQYFGEFAGVAPYMIKEQLVAALRPEIIRREQMSTSQLQNEYLAQQNEYLQQQRESEQQRRESEQASMEFQNSVKELRETHSITEDVWNQVKSELQQDLPEDVEMTPELVVKAVEYDRNYTQAESVLNTLPEKLENHEEMLDSLIEVKEKFPHFTDEDLKEVVTQALGTLQKSNAEENLKKKVTAKKAATRKQTQTQPQSEETDPELEDWFL